MNPIEIIAIIAIVLIVGGAVAYIIKAKKSGKRCIGCPDSCCHCKGGEANASGGCGGCGGECHCYEKNEE